MFIDLDVEYISCYKIATFRILKINGGMQTDILRYWFDKFSNNILNDVSISIDGMGGLVFTKSYMVPIDNDSVYSSYNLRYDFTKVLTHVCRNI